MVRTEIFYLGFPYLLLCYIKIVLLLKLLFFYYSSLVITRAFGIFSNFGLLTWSRDYLQYKICILIDIFFMVGVDFCEGGDFPFFLLNWILSTIWIRIFNLNICFRKLFWFFTSQFTSAVFNRTYALKYAEFASSVP